MTIFTEFRYLAESEGKTDAIAIIDALERGQYQSEDERRKMAHTAWALIAPPGPANTRYQRESFWGRASAKFIWWGLCGKKESERAAWMAEHRLRGTCRKPRFEPAYTMPQPSARRV